jgi:3'-5' exoribonuclease
MDEEIRKLCKYVFTEKFEKEFTTYPAAKSNHHSGCGGLIEHSVSLAKLAVAAAQHYSYDYEFDTDLIIAGALFQDVGKIFEFNVDNLFNTELSPFYNLKGHITIGNEILYESLAELKIDSKQDKFLKLSHIILSHHGKPEFHSPVFPVTPEAILISRLDFLESDIKSATTAIKSTREGESFTPRLFALDNRSVFMPNSHIYENEDRVGSDEIHNIEILEVELPSSSSNLAGGNEPAVKDATELF